MTVKKQQQFVNDHPFPAWIADTGGHLIVSNPEYNSLIGPVPPTKAVAKKDRKRLINEWHRFVNGDTESFRVRALVRNSRNEVVPVILEATREGENIIGRAREDHITALERLEEKVRGA